MTTSMDDCVATFRRSYNRVILPRIRDRLKNLDTPQEMSRDKELALTTLMNWFADMYYSALEQKITRLREIASNTDLQESRAQEEIKTKNRFQDATEKNVIFLYYCLSRSEPFELSFLSFSGESLKLNSTEGMMLDMGYEASEVIMGAILATACNIARDKYNNTIIPVTRDILYLSRNTPSTEIPRIF